MPNPLSSSSSLFCLRLLLLVPPQERGICFRSQCSRHPCARGPSDRTGLPYLSPLRPPAPASCYCSCTHHHIFSLVQLDRLEFFRRRFGLLHAANVGERIAVVGLDFSALFADFHIFNVLVDERD